ncbi:Uncharacterised protein [uncultured archaeon]|nr:Uncharacterised protein [uncultured archaeon]
MNITTIHIKTDIKTRDEAKKVAEEHGFSLTALVNVVLKQIARTKHLTLNLEEEPSEYLLHEMKQARENREAGKGSPHFTSDTKLIKKDPKKYRHIDTMQQWFEEQGI